jgi:hypothetical protein
MSERFVITRVAWIRHLLHDEQLHLLAKIERAPELQRVGLHRADAPRKYARSRWPTASVALVITQQQSSRNIIRRSTGATSIGAAFNERNCAVFPVRSIQ